MPPNDKFDVFVEGVRDGAPGSVVRAAQALAPRLAMPAERVAKLLGGRFRVRTGVDEDLARRLVKDLENYGLRIAVAPTGAKPSIPPRAAPAPRPPPAATEDDGGISIGGLGTHEPAPPAAARER